MSIFLKLATFCIHKAWDSESNKAPAIWNLDSYSITLTHQSDQTVQNALHSYLLSGYKIEEILKIPEFLWFFSIDKFERMIQFSASSVWLRSSLLWVLYLHHMSLVLRISHVFWLNHIRFCSNVGFVDHVTWSAISWIWIFLKFYSYVHL